MTDITDALERLGEYNGNPYTADNRYGFAGRGGMPANLPQFCRDTATVGAYIQTTYQLIQGMAGPGLSLPAGLNATPIGNTTPSTGAFTTLTATTLTTSGLLKAGSRTAAVSSESILVSPAAGVNGASTKVGVANSGAGDGSPNCAFLGVSGPALNGVAFLDTASFGVAANTPWDIRTAGVTQVRVNHTAGATSHITMAGGAGANATIGTSAAGLTLAPASGVVRVSGASSPYANVTDGTRTLNVGIDSANSTLSAFFNSTNGARLLASAGSVTAISYTAAGAVSLPGTSTTASGGNAYIDASTGAVLRSTSSEEYKTDIEPPDMDIIRALGPQLLDAAIWYRSTADFDNPSWSWWGMSAQRVAAVDPRLVHWRYPDDAYEDIVTGTVDEDVPVLEDAEETAHEIVVEEGRAVLRSVTRAVQRQQVDFLPIVTEAGEPVTDEEGAPLFHPVPRVQKVARDVTERRLKDDAQLVPDGVQYERVALILSLYLADKLAAA